MALLFAQSCGSASCCQRGAQNHGNLVRVSADSTGVLTREETVAMLDAGGALMEGRVRPEGTYDGWDGREVLVHLAVYARVVGALMRAKAEAREATAVELFGRELTDEELRLDLDGQNAAVQREYVALGWAEALAFWRLVHAQVRAQVERLSDAQLAAPGPGHLPGWASPHLSDAVVALCRHYQGHVSH
jgi:hypothetical protein